MIALVVTTLIVAATTFIPNQHGGYTVSGVYGCNYAIQTFRHINYPMNNRSDAAQIDHAVAILYKGDAVGWVFQTGNGKLYYEDGPLDYSSLQYTQHKPAPPNIAKAVLGALMPRYSPDLQQGAIYPVTTPPRLGNLKGHDLEFKGCY